MPTEEVSSTSAGCRKVLWLWHDTILCGCERRRQKTSEGWIKESRVKRDSTSLRNTLLPGTDTISWGVSVCSDPAANLLSAGINEAALFPGCAACPLPPRCDHTVAPKHHSWTRNTQSTRHSTAYTLVTCSDSQTHTGCRRDALKQPFFFFFGQITLSWEQETSSALSRTSAWLLIIYKWNHRKPHLMQRGTRYQIEEEPWANSYKLWNLNNLQQKEWVCTN